MPNLRQARFFLVAGAVLTAGVSGLQAQPPLQLEEVRSYGVADLGPESARLSQVERAAGGAMLGAVVGIVQGPDSAVYVLDQTWRKIVAFLPDGRVARVILGGAGEGPGEFRLPVHLAWSPDGLLAALDYQLSRVTFFDPATGEDVQQHVLPVGSPLRIYPAEDLTWVTRATLPGTDRPRAIGVGPEGRIRREVPAAAGEESRFPSVVNFAVDYSGRLLVPSPKPGLWDVWTPNAVDRRGQALIDHIEPPVVKQESGHVTIGSAEAETSGIAASPDGSILVMYRTQELLDRQPFPDPATVRHFIAVFDSAGSLRGVTQLTGRPGLSSKYFYVSPVTGHVFLYYSEPYPHVVEYRVASI